MSEEEKGQNGHHTDCDHHAAGFQCGFNMFDANSIIGNDCAYFWCGVIQALMVKFLEAYGPENARLLLNTMVAGMDSAENRYPKKQNSPTSPNLQ